MLALLQRVSRAEVIVAEDTIADIGAGLLVLIGVESGDSEAEAERLLERVLGYRVFTDAHRKMNLSVVDTGGGLLLVPQFTLPADTRKGMRPSLSSAAPPEQGKRLFEHLARTARERHRPVACGVFGAHMQVALVNDGPVTFLLRVAPASGGWPAP